MWQTLYRLMETGLVLERRKRTFAAVAGSQPSSEGLPIGLGLRVAPILLLLPTVLLPCLVDQYPSFEGLAEQTAGAAAGVGPHLVLLQTHQILLLP